MPLSGKIRSKIYERVREEFPGGVVLMVGPPSDRFFVRWRLFFYATERGEYMRWIGDLIAFVMLGTIVSFVVYVAIKSRMDEKKKNTQGQ
jgi:hypothetical protein